MKWVMPLVAILAVAAIVVVIVFTRRAMRSALSPCGFRKDWADEVAEQLCSMFPTARAEPGLVLPPNPYKAPTEPEHGTLTSPLHSYQLTATDRTWIEQHTGYDFHLDGIVVLPSGLTTTGAEMMRWVATAPVSGQR